MIVWGGGSPASDDGGRYDPRNDRWGAAPTRNGAPTARGGHAAVWTGSEMLIWGGTAQTGQALATGARFNPSTNTWVPVSVAQGPGRRLRHSVVWAGSELILWGGETAEPTDSGTLLNTGFRYSPPQDRWTPMSLTAAPIARENHAAVWTGSEMIVWGGDPVSMTAAGGRYDSAMDLWRPLGSVGAPLRGRTAFMAAWVGDALIVLGGDDGTGPICRDRPGLAA